MESMPKQVKKEKIKRFFSLRQRWEIILSTMVLNCLSLSIPLFVLHLYDRIFLHQLHDFFMLGMVLAVALSLETILQISQGYILRGFGKNRADLRDLHSEFSKNQFETLENIAYYKDFSFLLLFLGLMFYWSLYIALGVLLILGFFMAIIKVLNCFLRRYWKIYAMSEKRRYNFMTETLNNHHTLKALGMEDLILRRYERLQSRCAAIKYKISLYTIQIQQIVRLFSHVLFMGIALIACWQAMQETITIGVMAASLIFAYLVISPIQTLISLWVHFQCLVIPHSSNPLDKES